MDVILETEHGVEVGRVGDNRHRLPGLLPTSNSEFPMLRHIDPYGDTIFNRPQMQDVLPELEQLLSLESEQEARRLLEGVLRLARSCSAEPHLYLRFVGD